MRSTTTQATRPGQAAEKAARETTILGRYRVLETNDEGGFGTVNVCWDTRLQRRVAIKKMPLRVGESPSVSASTLDEALREARTSSLLPHQNIVTVFDFEADESYSYLVMEYVDGLNLADLLSRVEGGTLSFDECAHMLQSVGSALSYAHENGVLHLDIKPANIMIDRTGTVKLADFGMATLASAAGYGGARGGTIGYMPPEQIEGGYVDERTDIFALAVVVWQSLSGSSPFLAPTARESLRKIQRGPKPTLSEVEPALAGVVEETLLVGLDPEPAERMASVEELVQPVVAFLGDATEGRASLADLVSQSGSGEPEEDTPPDLPREPLLERLPWLPSATVRATSALCTACVAYETLRVYAPGSRGAALLGSAAMGACAAAWPPLGSALALMSLVLSLLAQSSTYAFPLALLLGIVSAAWWVMIGRRDGLATPAALLPAVLPCPFAGTFVAGYSLPPMPAFLTGAVSWGLGTLLAMARTCNFAADPLARSLRDLARDPSTFLMLIAAGSAALVCSLLETSHKAHWRVCGELACLTIPLLCRHLLAGMENAGNTAESELTSLLVAVVLCVIMCIVTVLVGPHRRVQGSEDF